MNLPEVVPDSSPQTLTSDDEAHLMRGRPSEPNPKFVVVGANGLVHRDTLSSSASAARAGGEKRPWGDPISELPATPPWSPSPQTARLCGLRRRLFWALVVVTVIAVGAIGGGLGGGLSAAKAKAQQAKAQADSSSAATATATAAATATETEATTLPSPSTPTFLNNETATSVGFAFQGFSDKNYGGAATAIVRDEGFLDLPFGCRSYVWLPNGTDCCITFCRSKQTAGGFRCQVRRQTLASVVFPRIWIGCGPDASEQHACS